MLLFFFFNDTATTEIYTLSLHDALPICFCSARSRSTACPIGTAAIAATPRSRRSCTPARSRGCRSEEHTSELQSLAYLVCRLLLEKKNRPRAVATFRSALRAATL